MANYSTTANIVLSVNGRQAQKMMSTLEKDARRLEKAIAKAAAAGDKATMKKLQRELNSTKKTMEQLKGASSTTENVLRRLDKASPRELNKALRQLQTQLNAIQRGTPAWDRHVAKIRAVKAELQKVNATLITQKSMWSRMNTWLNNTSTAIMGVVAALSGLIMAGRKSVSAYADMEEQMANTRKYTRMTAEQVTELNEIFKGMDTRIAREQLNLLAQEGGRLGYNTVETVKEYVEAASIINVALVDLGEGATQTIAKLSNIFGMEQMYGVRDAMLKIGSTVNHLSQNCTAAKPFIVEFAQRMAGIGSTAKMTIPEIMAFAATLDANGQKVEMSATAIQRTIMALYKKPGEMAKKVGLDAREFTETLNKSTTQGVMVFLEALNKLGESNALAVLSPLFQDLGLDGARVSSVLTNLSSHLEFLKWQMGEAAEAFHKGSSASNEYAIFNNTVQASIEKARARVRELAIELGEKLYPMMKHVYTSSSAFLRILNHIVSFIIKYKTVIISLGTALATYYTAALAAKTITFLYTKAITAYRIAVILCTGSQILYNRAVMTGKPILAAFNLVLAATANAVDYLSNGLQVNMAMQTRWRTAMSAMKLGTWVGLVTALASAFYLLASRTKTYTDKVATLTKFTEEFDKEMIKEFQDLDILFGKLDACEKGTEEYKTAKDNILKQYGKYLTGLVNERGEIIDLEKAYNRLTIAIQRSAQARLIDKMKKNVEDEFVKDLNKKINSLKEQLLVWGMPLREVTQVVTQIYMSASKGQKVPDSVAAQVAKYTQSFGSKNGESVWNKIVNYLNPFSEMPDSSLADISILTSGYNTTINALNQVKTDLKQFPQYDDNTLKQVRDNLKKGLDTYNEGLSDANNTANYLFGTYNPNFFQNPVSESLKKFTAKGLLAGQVYVWMPDKETSVGRSVKQVAMTPSQAKEMYDSVQVELAFRSDESNNTKDPISGNPDFDINDYTPYVTEKEKRAQAAEARKADAKARAEERAARAAARRAEIKARKEFKDSLNDKKGEWENRDTQNLTDFSLGLKSWHQFLIDKYNSEVQYFDDRIKLYEDNNLKEDEDYQELLKKKAELQVEWLRQNAALEVAEAKRKQQEEETQAQMDYYTPGNSLYQKEEALNLKLHEIRIKYLTKMRNAYQITTEEYHNYDVQIEQAEAEEKLRIQKRYAEKIEEWKSKYEYQEASKRLEQEMTILKEAYEKKLITEEQYQQAKKDLKKTFHTDYLPESAQPSSDSKSKLNESMLKDLAVAKSLFEQGVIDKEQYEEAKDRIENTYRKKHLDAARKFNSTEANQLIDIYEAWQNFFKKTEDDGGNWATRLASLASAVFAVMNAGMQQYSEYSQACTDLEVAKTEKKYERELELAEGNSYRTKKLEKQKEAEIAKIKSDASKKQFAMQVIQAVAQTAINALNAYGSAAAVPVIGYILAPIAASMAVAAGAIQIATLKKQQQTAEIQGYSEGGFTPSGRKDEPVGVVHAGEWVASQKLVNNSKTRPLLEALEYAQRTNTIGSLTASDVSRSITAPMIIASQQSVPPTIMVDAPPATVIVDENPELVMTIKELNNRLRLPFVTVNTVSGDHGIQQAQEEYAKLMRNKSPKKKS